MLWLDWVEEVVGGDMDTASMRVYDGLFCTVQTDRSRFSTEGVVVLGAEGGELSLLSGTEAGAGLPAMAPVGSRSLSIGLADAMHRKSEVVAVKVQECMVVGMG